MISIDDYEPSIASDENGEPQSVLDLIAPISDEVDFTLQISQLEQQLRLEGACCSGWVDIKLAELQVDMHDQALSISDSREEYIKRRKTLASNLRAFTSEVLNESCTLELGIIQERTKNIIELFKKDFDFLAGICKNTETSYLSLYKLLRDAPDPHTVFEASFATIEQSIQTMHKAEKQIARLTKALEEKEVECAENRLANQDDMLLTDGKYQAKLEASLVEVRARFAQELVNRERNLRDGLERSKFEAQERFEGLLARKEAELEDLQERLRRAEQQVASATDEKTLQVSRHYRSAGDGLGWGC